jgi:hypothetical protein
MPYVINITYVLLKMRASIEPLAGDSRHVKRIISLTGTCPVPPKRDRREEGAQYE